MNPEEKVLLERSLKLAQENNRLLHKLESRAKWATVWGFLKLMIVVVPLVAGYIFLEPYLNQALENVQDVQEFLKQ